MSEKATTANPAVQLTWTPALAVQIAATEELSLTEDHWIVLQTLQEFYAQFHRHPALRILVRQLADKWTTEKAQSLYLHQLFPGGVIKQASIIAGLPKPLKCL